MSRPGTADAAIELGVTRTRVRCFTPTQIRPVQGAISRVCREPHQPNNKYNIT